MNFWEFLIEALYPIKYDYYEHIDWAFTILFSIVDLLIVFVVVVIIMSIIEDIRHKNGIRSGIVYDKKFIAEHTETTYVMVDKVMVPVFTQYDDEYIIYIKDKDKTNYWKVDDRTYKRIKKGQKFDYDKYLNS